MSVSGIESLSALNALASEQSRLDRSREKIELASKLLGSLRNSEHTNLVGAIVKLSAKHLSDHEREASAALFEVLNECKHDLIRLAELRLDAVARDYKIKAAQKRAVIAASIISVEPPK